MMVIKVLNIGEIINLLREIYKTENIDFDSKRFVFTIEVTDNQRDNVFVGGI